MATISHKTLSGTQLHEPKGVGSATTGTVYVADGAGSGAWRAGGLSRGYIDGCTLSNAAGDTTNDIAIAAGVCKDSTNSFDITVAAMATGKRLDAGWVPGDAQGMRNSAAAITNTTYHIYAVVKADGTQDIYAHTSTTVATVITALQAEAGGASYVYARRIGSIVRSAGAIVLFSQRGDEFLFLTQTEPLAAGVNLGTSGVLLVVTGVPTGVKMNAHLIVSALFGTNGASQQFVLVTSPDQTDVAASTTALTTRAAGTSIYANATTKTRTDTSGQIRYRLSSTGAADTLRINCEGFTDSRGKNE